MIMIRLSHSAVINNFGYSVYNILTILCPFLTLSVSFDILINFYEVFGIPLSLSGPHQPLFFFSHETWSGTLLALSF